ncbi:ribulose 1,5-bisphosphate carboxylase [Pseudooceanicola sediminis]|uniref:Ribulose 1,5-bisphosphate carboxylase n=1 Tax=Pseudooceanicola sediminis TaxID=2211117 RepID=A0A399J4G3_9RHOB|nr:ribulose-bisphosphate carboxylase large subunit family protein [Pseudooceanicola sediminis]KAA2315049.1 ribulose 1,5-bisphosphate carboxylase [Puniceibacterium sp. HSS470]RII38862.1 ribulose 1,5-bisphosphate carboxylase [Pseudooceanicola sediminis]|tara:strand:- start:52955 stop:54220 length:1266 start_codon:yes stop_codon:yes gene_type:complete
MERVIAEYLVETPVDVARVAAMMAGEQSSGTFVRVAGETDEVRARSAAEVLSVEVLGEAGAPTLDSAFLQRAQACGPWRFARVRIAFPTGNIGRNLATLAATVSGNLYDIGEVTGLKLVALEIPASYRTRYALPRQGIAGTRASTGVQGRPIFGTIIKPNVGLRSAEIAALVDRLCAAGVDFIKDDEVCANPDWAPLAERVPAVMAVIRKWREATGRQVMMAFNISDEVDAMRRHADLVAAEGGSCVMASMNWVGLSGMETLRAHTPLAIHAHRNGFGAMSRHPRLGMGFQAYHTLYRLAGIDHMHVHGIGGKFVDSVEEVTEAARACLQPLCADGPDDRVMPAFSSGQWAGTLPVTLEAAQSPDLMFMCGGGILAHPDGPEAGIDSLRDAYAAAQEGLTLHEAAKTRPALAAAIGFFGGH